MDKGGQEKVGREGGLPAYVVDASVVAKWILPGEPYEEQSVRLKEDSVSGMAALHSPSILRYELASLLSKASREKRISGEDAKRGLGAVGRMHIAVADLDWEEAEAALGMASDLGLNVYDAAYVLVSKALGVPLITADGRMCEKAGAITRSLHIRDY